MKNIVAALLVVLVGSLAACGGAGVDQGKETTPGQSAAGGGDSEAMCREMFARERTCTDDYIPALVDLRIELDLPAGITAEGKKEGGRDSLITQAKAEWSTDSAPDAVAARCKDMQDKVSAEQKAELMAAYSKCAPITDCKAFTECVIPITKKLISMKK